MTTRSTRHGLAATLVLALALFGSACSSDDSDSADTALDDATVETADPSGDSTDGSGDSTESDPGDDSESGSGDIADADCQALLEARAPLSSTANLLSVLDTPSAFDAAFGDDGLDQTEEQIELFRPHQDVEGVVFGTLREGLDNLENDIAAVREGRLDDRVGEYNVVAIAPVLEAIGC